MKAILKAEKALAAFQSDLKSSRAHHAHHGHHRLSVQESSSAHTSSTGGSNQSSNSTSGTLINVSVKFEASIEIVRYEPLNGQNPAAHFLNKLEVGTALAAINNKIQKSLTT